MESVTGIESIWNKTCKIERKSALNGDIKTDVAVIGGGMAGILTAYQLERAGVHTVVLEAEQIGGGQTKNTTAKITCQHGLFCRTFIEKKGQRDCMSRRTRMQWRNIKELSVRSR